MLNAQLPFAFLAASGTGEEEGIAEVVMHHIANSPVHLPAWLEPYLGDLFHTLHITKAVMMMLIASTLLIVVMGVFLRRPKLGYSAPRGMANALEAMVVFVRDEVAISNMGKKWGRRFTPFLLTLFFFILTCNMLGLVPGGFTATSNLNVTGTLALMSFFTFLVTGIYALGPVGYVKHMVPQGTPLVIAPVVVILEVISTLVRPAALMIRLGANMTAGHIVILIILGFIFLFQSVLVSAISVPLAVAITLLELIVALIQAYVFTLLTALYVGLLVADEH
ncbi:MAG: F0F1 ATP synthase subunit A [Bryobacterales bacterium]|nr:F0F1 ATP synthase subunit A [Bryobacterales bacterium]